jgi:uncharacterized membrane protein YhaH (DUF805 family)
MKAGYKTTEFWMSLIVTITNMLVSFGIITSEDASILATIAPQFVTVVVSLAYVLSRWSLKLQAK